MSRYRITVDDGVEAAHGSCLNHDLDGAIQSALRAALQMAVDEAAKPHADVVYRCSAVELATGERRDAVIRIEVGSTSDGARNEASL